MSGYLFQLQYTTFPNRKYTTPPNRKQAKLPNRKYATLLKSNPSKSLLWIFEVESTLRDSEDRLNFPRISFTKFPSIYRKQENFLIIYYTVVPRIS